MENITYGVFVNDAAGEIFVNRILDIPNGYQEAGGSHANLLKEFDTEEEAYSYKQEMNGDKLHYLVYRTHDDEYYYVTVKGEYFGTYQENAYSSYDDYVCTFDTEQEAINYCE